MQIALSGLWPGMAADPFAMFSSPPLGGWPGLVVVMVIAWLLYRIGLQRGLGQKRLLLDGGGIDKTSHHYAPAVFR